MSAIDKMMRRYQEKKGSGLQWHAVFTGLWVLFQFSNREMGKLVTLTRISGHYLETLAMYSSSQQVENS